MGEVADRADDILRATAADLLRFFRRRVGPEDAADLLSDTLTTAWRRVHAMPADPEAARMWLFRIARNNLLNHDRSERRRHRLAARLRQTLGDLADPPADSGVEVRDAIARLDPVLGEVVRLVHWDGFTLQQVADLLDVPSSTVRNRYQRAKADLRSALGALACDY